MTQISDFILHLNAFIAQEGLTKNALACKAGLAPNTLKKLGQADWNPSLETLQKLEAVMNEAPSPISSSTEMSGISGISAITPHSGLVGKKILLIITGGIAAYKALDLIRRLQDAGAQVTGVMTKGAGEFITPLSVAGLTGQQCYTDLFDLKDESEMGHIKLSRDSDLLLVAPATADIMAKMAAGLAGDLASTLLLATDKPVMVAPAMNSQMWAHPSTQRSIATLKQDGIHFVDPASGLLACGEIGPGKLADVMDIVAAVQDFFIPPKKPLTGQTVVMTAGPTYEPIDPVRFIANRSSGKQGYALAAALAEAGASVTLITGPTALPTPTGVTRIDIETAQQMHDAVHRALPATIAIFVAAVADWRTKGQADQKMKKEGRGLPDLQLVENPDILASVCQHPTNRPDLVIGFAAETENILDHAAAKRLRKGCDWIIANDVSHCDNNGVMGGDHNQAYIIDSHGVVDLPLTNKQSTARLITQEIIKKIEADHEK